MKIRVNTQECVYIEINGYTYYIDDSTNEQFIDKWVTGTEDGGELADRDGEARKDLTNGKGK